MHGLRKVVISVGFSRIYSEIGARGGGHVFPREAPAAQNAEDSTDIRQLATLELNRRPKVLIKPRNGVQFPPQITL